VCLEGWLAPAAAAAAEMALEADFGSILSILHHQHWVHLCVVGSEGRVPLQKSFSFFIPLLLLEGCMWLCVVEEQVG
jgi:hypothetical protein